MATKKPKRRASNGKKPSSKKRSSTRASHKKGSGRLVIILIVLAALIAGGLYVANIAKELNKEEIIKGVSVDGIDVSGMTKEEAYSAVEDAAEQKLEKIQITFRYNDKQWSFDAEDLQANIAYDKVVDEAYNTGKEGTLVDKYKAVQQTQLEGKSFKSSFVVDRQVLIDALEDVKKEIDQPMEEPKIVFDPSGVGYEEFDDPEFDEVAAMFTITEGRVGYAMDYDKAIQDLNAQLEDGWTADIELSVVESHPSKNVEELKECTTLIFHSSSYLNSVKRQNLNRNHNIEKAIGFYKGLVVEPGDIVSYNDLLGERTLASGWLEAPTIARDKTLKDEVGGGICQSATTIFNAAFMSGAKIIEVNLHSWAAYYNDFGYGMDAMVNWGTSDFVFQNDSEYPIFFNTYFWYDANGKPGYVDVDVYTMPQKDSDGTILYIRADSEEIRREAPPEMEYVEVDEATAAADYPQAEWEYDATLKKMVFQMITPRDLVEYSIDRVWFKDAEATDVKGQWTGGEEVKREYSHTHLYKAIQGKTIVKPTPTPAPTPVPTAAPTPTPEPTPSGGASG